MYSILQHARVFGNCCTFKCSRLSRRQAHYIEIRIYLHTTDQHTYYFVRRCNLHASVVTSPNFINSYPTHTAAGRMQSTVNPYIKVKKIKILAFVRLSSVTVCIVAKRCVLEQKLLWTVYRKSYMRNRLVPK